MIMFWLTPALLLTLGSVLWTMRKPREFAALERRERAIEVLRDINAGWTPPELKRITPEPVYAFDDVQEV